MNRNIVQWVVFVFWFSILVFCFCYPQFRLQLTASVPRSLSVMAAPWFQVMEALSWVSSVQVTPKTATWELIWYKNIPVTTVVWVANRCNPINDSSGELMINSTGNLVLLGQNKSVVWWASAGKNVQSAMVQLLDSGNLVLIDVTDGNSSGSYMWQSFDYPCDTLLPDMKMGWDLRTGLKRGFSAWKNSEDPCPGEFTYGIEMVELHAYPEAYIRKGGVKYYRTGPWNGLRFSGSPELRPSPLYSVEFVYNDDEMYYMYNVQCKCVTTITVLNGTTSTRDRLTWIEAEQTWRAYSSVPIDFCDQYGLCGANANCITGESPPCQCLKGFKPNSPEKWNLTDWSLGCVRNKPLSCQERDKAGFFKFTNLKLPDTTHSWVNKSMNIKECRTKWLNNCSCMAYTSSDIREGGSGCAIWFGDLHDIRKFPDAGQDLYIRMSASELRNCFSNNLRVRSVLQLFLPLDLKLSIRSSILFLYNLNNFSCLLIYI